MESRRWMQKIQTFLRVLIFFLGKLVLLVPESLYSVVLDALFSQKVNISTRGLSKSPTELQILILQLQSSQLNCPPRKVSASPKLHFLLGLHQASDNLTSVWDISGPEFHLCPIKPLLQPSNSSPPPLSKPTPFPLSQIMVAYSTTCLRISILTTYFWPKPNIDLNLISQDLSQILYIFLATSHQSSETFFLLLFFLILTLQKILEAVLMQSGTQFSEYIYIF